MEKKKRTEIAEVGKFGLIERLMGTVGDDAAVVEGRGIEVSVGGKETGILGREVSAGGRTAAGNEPLSLLASAMLLEGVDFDLTYFPLTHLGHKAITVAAGDILAMNGLPVAATLSLGVSAKLSVEDLEQLHAGAHKACEELDMRLAGLDIKSSLTGLAIGVSIVGKAAPDTVVHRHGARENDLVCITGDLGAAYLGLHLLEREKRALAGVETARPEFDGYEYLLRRQLNPRARKDVVDALAAEGSVPTAMTDISDGLASDVLQICRASNVGARIYLDKLPIARETYALAEELHIDPVVAALNGGDDHELLFTVPVSVHEKVARLGLGIEIVGHITAAGTGAALVTPDGSDIPLRAQGFKN